MLGNVIRSVLILAVISFYSCSKEDKNDSYVEKHYASYSEIHKTIIDSVRMYTDSFLKDFSAEYRYGWFVDSMILLNSEKNKTIALIIEEPNTGKGFLSDDAMMLLGKKIDGKWYFFKGGGTLMVPRGMTNSSENKAPSHEALSQIARKELLSGAIIKKNGRLVVNDAWVDAYFYNNGFYTFGPHKIPGMISEGEEFKMPRDKARFDSVHWALIHEKWKKRIDTTAFKRYVPKPAL